MTRRVGIIGTGHLAGYLVEGWHRALPHLEVTLSPRNRARAGHLAAQFGAAVAADNQAVADTAEVLVLSTRPRDALAACRTLAWRPEQLVVSVAAGVPLNDLAGAVAPAAAVRAMPISCAAINQSPTLLYPHDPRARNLFSHLGPVHVLPDEEAFTAASAIAAWYAWLYSLFAGAEAWATAAGVAQETARTLVLQTAAGAANMALSRPGQSLPDLLATLATPGGLTELGLEVLRAGDGLSAWSAALDAVLARLQAAPSQGHFGR